MANLANRLVKIEHGVPKVSQKLAEFMASCKARQNTRYALNNVGVTGGQMVVTNGRVLLIVTLVDTFDPPIADGLYHLTGEGFLLKTNNDDSFPKWRDSIPKSVKTLGDFSLVDGDGSGIAKAGMAIANAGCLVNPKWLLSALEAFRDCGCGVVKIMDPEGNTPILITGEGLGASIQYIQMPMHNGKPGD